MYLEQQGVMGVPDFCDFDKGDGIVCNRVAEIVVKEENYDIYLCKRCLYMMDIEDVKDKAYYINQYERFENE